MLNHLLASPRPQTLGWSCQKYLVCSGQRGFEEAGVGGCQSLSMGAQRAEQGLDQPSALCGPAQTAGASSLALEHRWGTAVWPGLYSCSHPLLAPAAHQLFSCLGDGSLPARKFPEFLYHEISLWPSWDTKPGTLGRVLWALGQVCLRVIDGL